jgi:hypothetical protein
MPKPRSEWALALLPLFLVCQSLPAQPTCAPGQAGRRVGTLADSLQSRSWAVIADCRHPGWPAHLESAAGWAPLPAWVPAGRSLAVHARGSEIEMDGRTLIPGRVGDTVRVRLRTGATVAARLEDGSRAALVVDPRWRQP